MKFIFNFILISILPILSCHSNQALQSQATYLETSQVVMAQFFKTFSDSLFRELPPVHFAKRKKAPQFIQRETSNNQKISYLIKPYLSLNATDQYVLSKWAKEQTDGDSGEVLYYKLVNYWLLGHQLSHTLSIPENAAIKDMAQYEITLDQYNWYFMITNGYLNEFRDFHQLLAYIHQETAQKLGATNRTFAEIIQENAHSSDLIHFLYVRSWAMIKAFEQVK